MQKDENPSHFKPFVTHSPKDYQNKDKQVDPKKVVKFDFFFKLSVQIISSSKAIWWF